MKILKVLAFSSLGLWPAAPGFSQVQIGGFIEYDNLTYFKSLGRDKVNGRNQAILQLELQHQVNEKADLFAAVELREDQADPARNRIYLDEAYLNLYFSDLEIRLGKQIHAWGRADSWNPTDNLAAWDFSDILDTEDERIGVISARVNYYYHDWELEGVLIPSFSPSVWPETSSRWWPDFAGSFSCSFSHTNRSANPNVRYAFTSPLLPENGTGSTQYAVKISGSAKGWDFSLSWFDGFDDLPGLDVTVVEVPPDTLGEVTIRPHYHRRRAIGADFATVLGKVGLRGETAYYLTKDWNGNNPTIDDPYLQAVIGIDRTFSNLFAGKDLYVLAQWSQEFQIPNRDTAYELFDLNHVFRKSVLAKADLVLGSFSKLYLESVYNFSTDDWWFRPGLEWSITDGVKLLAHFDFLGGVDNSFFGVYRENRRLQIRAKYSFQARG